MNLNKNNALIQCQILAVLITYKLHLTNKAFKINMQINPTKSITRLSIHSANELLTDSNAKTQTFESPKLIIE